MEEIKKILFAVALAIVIVVGAVVIWTNGDARLNKAKERRDAVVMKIEQTRRTTAKILEKHQQQIKEIEREEEIFAKKIKIDKEIITTKQESFKEIKKSNDKDFQIKTLMELLELKDNLIVKQNYQINLLNNKIDLLKSQNQELQLQLEIAYQVQDESVQALNINLLDMKALTARDKAMKIGLGVGIPLAIAGGVLGGFYIGGLIR